MKATITHKGSDSIRKMFMKTRFNETTDDLYHGEFLGLQAMYEACPSSTPEPLAHGNFCSSVGCFLVTEFLERKSETDPSPTSTSGILSLAQKLAYIHLASTPTPEGFSTHVFGFPAITYCGPTAQANKYYASWHDFFVHDRVQMILQACEVGQSPDDELRYWVEKTIAGPVARLLGDGHLGGADGIKPAVVHGNLWYGNKMRGIIWGRDTREEQAGEPVIEDVLFDPSSAWCHNEFEMGILVLFGGFSAGFFQEYHSLVAKTEPVDEYDDRVGLYQLYHQLNHYALFGGKYRAESIERMMGLCERYPATKDGGASGSGSGSPV